MRKAFTMLELIFVIVVIGIISAVVLPRTDSNALSEAATDLVSKISYAQHLYRKEDKFGENASGVDWFKRRWQIRFTGNTYSVYSNNSTPNYALDPLTKEPIQDIDLNDKYSVTLSFSGTECGTAISTGVYGISFDHMGRPITGDLNTLTGAYVGTKAQLVVTDDCAIVLTHGDENATINIKPETGYVSISYP